MWERAVALEPSFATPWRNLGIGYFNVLQDTVRALQAFAKARAAAPYDARILYEYDQLLKRTGHALPERLAGLEANAELVEKRDDLSGELATLYNNLDQPQRALDLLLSHEFQPWEGGEGLVLSQYVRANVLLAHRALVNGEPMPAIASLLAASNPPENLSEAKHLLMNLSMIDYWLGVAHHDAGNHNEAERHWIRAACQKGDFQQMQTKTVSENTYWSAWALRRLGHEQGALDAFRTILDYSAHLQRETPKIDYFATSILPCFSLTKTLPAARLSPLASSRRRRGSGSTMRPRDSPARRSSRHGQRPYWRHRSVAVSQEVAMHGSLPPAIPQSSPISPQHDIYVWGIALAAALGGLLFGYDWVVIGGARQFYEVYFHLTSAAVVGWANSCALIGCLLGSLSAGTSPTAMAAAAFYSSPPYCSPSPPYSPVGPGPFPPLQKNLRVYGAGSQ